MILAGIKWEQFKDLLPLIGAALGYAAGLATVWLTQHRQDRRERVRWMVEQQAATLTELGDVLRTLSERMQVVIRQKQDEHKKLGGQWPDRVEATDSEWAARSRALVLMHRLADGGLRDIVDRFTTMTTKAATGVDPATAVPNSLTAAMEWSNVNESLGVALRELYP